jgi:hypothetical protein
MSARRARHAFEAIQLDAQGRESILDTFTVTKRRNADCAFDLAETLCERARKLPHHPAAFVREVNEPDEGTIMILCNITDNDLRELHKIRERIFDSKPLTPEQRISITARMDAILLRVQPVVRGG